MGPGATASWKVTPHERVLSRSPQACVPANITASGAREHAIDRFEVPPRIREHFGVGGVIGALDRHDAAAQRRMLVAEVSRKLRFGLRRSNDQDFMRAL